MPSYDMRCGNKECLYEFEIFQKNSDKPKRKCPKCKKLKLERLISACHGYVAAKQGDMKTIGDLANFNRDAKSRWEKESADKEYADSSRMAAAKLRQEKTGEDRSFFGASESKMAKIANLPSHKQEKYIATGEL
jgi:putative FmdB family regulatory protein